MGSGKEAIYKHVQRYIHVSKIKIPANPKSSRYFDFELQEGEREARVVCFNADQMDEVKSKEDSKVPVTVTNVSPTKRRYSENVEYRMNKFSRVSRAKNLEIRRVNSIKEILDSIGVGDIVRLKAKVLQKSQTTSVYSRVMKKDLSKCDVVVADLGVAMVITLWEENISKVSVDNSCCFYEMVVNSGCY